MICTVNNVPKDTQDSRFDVYRWRMTICYFFFASIILWFLLFPIFNSEVSYWVKPAN